MSVQSVSVSIDKHHVLRERVFSVTGRDITLDVIGAILCLLRDERATGSIIINVAQGTPGVVQFKERAKII